MESWKSLTLLVLGAVLATVGVACSEGEETLVPATIETTIGSTDGLDCTSDSRMSTIMEPVEGFEGHASPEGAVAAIAVSVGIDGTPELQGETWYIRDADGRAVGMARVEPWGEGWFAGEITVCDDGA